MTIFNALDLIPTVATIREDVLRNRETCTTDFARSLHDTLLARLGEVAADLDEEIETEKQFAAEKGTPDGDFLYEIYHVCTFFEHRWTDRGPISILDGIHELVVIEDDAFYYPRNFSEVSDPEMEGLGDILATIHRQTRIRFVAARV